MRNFFSKRDIWRLQDDMADAGYIVGISQMSHVRLYVYNEYLKIGCILPDFVGGFNNVYLAYHKVAEMCNGVNIDMCNYFQWCKLTRTRTDWLNDPRFSAWAECYRMYKIAQLFDK